ncbi:MAG: pilus assembly PilX N-terminal domain-containing protein [Deinococcales bacterium]
MRRNVEGIALVTALAILAIVTLLVVGTVFTTQIESWTTRNDATSTQAYYIAHAGLEKYKTIAFQTYNFYLNHLQDYGDSLGTTAICGNLLASGLDLDRDFSFSSTNDLLPGGSITRNYGGGTYKITYAVSGPDIVLTSVGTIHKARATVQVVFHPQNAGLFSNALFAGGGISSQYINGDAQVYGSVYVEGDAANPTTVINSNGNFSMHNYYDSTEIANLFGNTFTTTQLKSMLGATATDHGRPERLPGQQRHQPDRLVDDLRRQLSQRRPVLRLEQEHAPTEPRHDALQVRSLAQLALLPRQRLAGVIVPGGRGADHERIVRSAHGRVDHHLRHHDDRLHLHHHGCEREHRPTRLQVQL